MFLNIDIICDINDIVSSYYYYIKYFYPINIEFHCVKLFKTNQNIKKEN